ncbi:MAG TPA: glutamine--fructose-6-phosphate transaminase (isomerizing) [Gemmatimonadales bacterium]|nr:glutamine--fructose-6-phosphate transaminase (isomerizing) [Gemmatimonadales bacterium]
MCGIVGYVGRRDAAGILIDGLARLEYRGYDSAGVAIQNGRGVVVRKLAGRVGGLRDALTGTPVAGTSGIAHTRWATHGAPNQVNAHPHVDCTERIALVHNGIIENAEALREALERAGHTFRTQTDTEVIAHLIEDAEGSTLEERVIAALARVEGAYGIAVMSADEPGKIVIARKGSPVLLGVGDGEYFVASDASALLEHTRSVVYLNDGDIAIITPDGYRVIDRHEHVLSRPVDDITWDLEAIELGGYPHFMLKEISEQPESVRSTLRGHLLFEEGTARLHGLNLTPADCAAINRIVILACGTSWHAGLVGRYLIEELAGIPVVVEYASEYRYRPQVIVPGTLAVAISQSGETADTLEAMRTARASGATVVGLVNVVGSTIAREADGGIYLHAGPEIGVASTKAFTSQITALVLLGLYLGRQRGLSLARGQEIVYELARLPDLIDEVLELAPVVEKLAKDFASADNFLYLGRGINFPVALEGALKLKEISYIHAEGYPAAEMKHGPIALIDENMPVVFVAPTDHLSQKGLSNLQEVKARGGRVISITNPGEDAVSALSDHELQVPRTLSVLSPILTSVPLQLLAYHIAVLRGCDVDRPRNLAKSVTVE